MLYAKGLIVSRKENSNPSESEIFTFRFTSEVIDRMEEIVEMDGWEFANFMLNAVFLAVHDYRKFPIGKVLAVYKISDSYYCDVVFDLKDPLGEMAAHKYRNKFLNAVSVGFKSLEIVMPTKDGEFLRHKRKELLEISAVPVPANPEALMQRGIDDETYHAIALMMRGLDAQQLEAVTDDGRAISMRAGESQALIHGDTEEFAVGLSLPKAEYDALLKYGDGPAAWLSNIESLKALADHLRSVVEEKKLGKGKRAELTDIAETMDKKYKALASACDDLVEKCRDRLQKMLDDMMMPEEEEEPKAATIPFDAEGFLKALGAEMDLRNEPLDINLEVLLDAFQDAIKS